MQKIMIALLAVILMAGCTYRTGSGNIVTEKRNTGSFTGISVGGAFDVEVKYAVQEEVLVEADDNLQELIETKVVGGQLKISTDHANIRDAHMKIYISAPEINKIRTSASATVRVTDMLKSSGRIILNASSASEINAAIDAPEVEIDASSGAELELSGRTRDLKAETSSGANLKANSLLSEKSTVKASSGASAAIHASVSLDAKASSGASVRYLGSPSVTRTVSSGGSVDKY